MGGEARWPVPGWAVYAALASIIVTVGLGVVGAAGADQAANATSTRSTAADCASPRTPSTCPAGGPADVTINPARRVTCHFDNPDRPHNAVAKRHPVAWPIRRRTERDHPDEGSYPKRSPSPAPTVRLRAAPDGMRGTITVTATPVPRPRHATTTRPTATSTATSTADLDGHGDADRQPAAERRRHHARPDDRRRRGHGQARRPRRAAEGSASRGARALPALGVGHGDGARQARGSRTVLTSARKLLRAGTRDVTLRSQKLKKGRYTVEIEARDAYGNRSPLAKKQVRVK